MPKPQARVKESRKIYLTVTKHSDCTVKLYYDQIIGRSRTYVAKQLERNNLRIGKMIPRSGGKAENTIVEAYINGVPLFIEANPDAGEKPPVEAKEIPQNAVVDLVFLQGIDAEPKVVPELNCYIFEQAEIIIKSNLFNVGTIHTKGSIIDTLNAWVVQQSPAAFTVTTMGAGVELWLQKERPGNCPKQE